MYTYEFPRPSVTVDCIVFGFDEGDLKILLIKRGNDPYKGKWALPGGFVEMDETCDDAAQRELEEETGVKNLFMEQLYTFSNVNRDPRGRVIAVGYFALVKLSSLKVHASSDADSADWFPVNKLPPLAFDHPEIIRKGLERLRAKVRYQPIGFELLPEKFTLPELHHLYEAVLGEELDRRNFRRKIFSTGLIIPLKETKKETAGRKPQLLKFDKVKYKQLVKKGFNFEL